MKNIVKLTALMLIAAFGSLHSQPPRATGLIIEEDITAKVPQRATLLTRSYEDIPAAYSLKGYAPSVRNQSGGTCVGWSSAYAARTIAEAIANGWTDKATIDREAYSAVFLYSLIRDGYKPNCEDGTRISDAVRKLREVGAAKRSDVPEVCPVPSPERLFSKAGEHRVDAYFTTFSQRDPPNFKVFAVRKAVSQNRPVVVAMPVYESFDRQGGGNGGVWNGFTTSALRGYHAMCVVGYDDNKAGGAFEIMNSWGTDWGDKGFVWVRYADFGAHAVYGHDVHVRPKQKPQPQPQPQPQPPQPQPPQPPQPQPQPPQPKPQPPQPQPPQPPPPPPPPPVVSLSGSLQFKLSNGVEMAAVLKNGAGLPTYRMAKEYISGTRFRIYLSNDEPAYVYVVGSDLANSVYRIFPHDDRTSAALFYDKNDIALPDEKHLFQLDDTKGTTYALVLYSRDELPIDDIVKRIRGGSGDFAQRAKSAVGGGLVPSGEVSLERQTIKFASKSASTVVAIVVEIDHAGAGY